MTTMGIEIGTTSVRVAVVSSDSHPKLLQFAEAPLSAGTVVDGGLVDRDDAHAALAKALDQLGARRGLRTTRLTARLVASGLGAITREIEMPAVPDAELESAVRLQALDIVPFPHDRTLLAARRMRVPETGNALSRSRVLLAAAHRDLIEPLVAVVEACGVEVSGVDLAPFALVRSLGSTGDGAEAIVTVGAELTTIVVHEDGEAQFVRTIAGGGGAVTRAIATALDMPYPDAEQVKIALSATDGTDVRIPADVIAAARDASASLLGDIRSSVQYYASLPGRNEVRRVVLTGGGSQLPGFLERLQHQMRATVSAGSVFARIESGTFDGIAALIDPTVAAVIGTTLAEPAGQRRLDLLPPEIRERRQMRRVEQYALAGVSVIVLILVGLGALRFLQVRSAESDVGALQSSISSLRAQIPRYDAVAREHDTVLAEQRLALPLVSGEVNWPAVLSELARYTPSSVSTGSFSGTTSTPATTASTTATSTTQTGSAPASATSLPAPTAVLGTLQLTLTGADYPSFQAWFDEITSSKRFAVDQYSGVTSAQTGITFTAELGITGLIHTDRLAQFQGVKP